MLETESNIFINTWLESIPEDIDADQKLLFIDDKRYIIRGSLFTDGEGNTDIYDCYSY